MKSETVEQDRINTESRHSVHRRKMSKNSPIVNGAGENLSYAEDESVVRQINLAAAMHDHISCTKSAEICKIEGNRETKTSLPCETDHIYANCSTLRLSPLIIGSFDLSSLDNIDTLRTMLDAHIRLLNRLERDVLIKNSEIRTLKQENAMLRARLDRRGRMCLLKKRRRKAGVKSTDNSISMVESALPPEPVSTNTTLATPNSSVAEIAPNAPEHPNTISSVNLVTRYFGRRSKTIPSRALKRRYLGPPKTIPSTKLVPKSLSSATSISSASEAHEEVDSKIPKVIQPVFEKSPLVSVKRIKKKGKRPKGISPKTDFLTTDKAYFLPSSRRPCTSPLPSPNRKTIRVPSWRMKPVTSFYQMEGTENINDPVYERRHVKEEQDERRRKRWDIQRLREQKASEKLKHKYCRDSIKDTKNVQQKPLSFFPNPRHLQYIEITNDLPVLAFGHLIPLFQPSEFSLPWKIGESNTPEIIAPIPILKGGKKSRLSTTAPKVT